jgi:hypothetical protein
VADYLVPASGPEDWRALLAAPRLHWRTGASAFELATSWHGRRAPPSSVEALLAAAGDPQPAALEVILGIPEHKTPLAGGSRPSQTDLLCICRRPAGGLVVVAVEGKAEEPSGPEVQEWLKDKPPSRNVRLAAICETLGLDASSVGALRYQLLYRATAAIIEAKKFGADTAVMVVHSFSPHNSHFPDFALFVDALGRHGCVPGELCDLGLRSGVRLYAGWAPDAPAVEARPAGAVGVAGLALDWLETHYRAQRAFNERDIEAALQRRLIDLIDERRLPLRVLNGYPIERQPGRQALCVDLAVLGPDDSVELAIELKYEPSHARADIWPTKFPVVSWSEVIGDMERLKRWVGAGNASAGLGAFIDEGRHFAARPAPAGATWETWTLGASNGPHPAILVSRF